MRIKFDAEADALYIRLHDAEILKSEEVSPGVIVDFDGQDRVVGFEVLDFRKRLAEADLERVTLDWPEMAAGWRDGRQKLPGQSRSLPGGRHRRTR